MNPLFGLIEGIGTLVERVGRYQVERFRAHPAGAGTEKSLKEYVSAVDVESEQMLRAGLASLRSDVAFYGEETARERHLEEVWVVDPLDGTTNYLSGHDEWSISVALVRNDTTLLGYVRKPYIGEVYAGVRGAGAWFIDHQGRRRDLPKALPISLKDALICTGFPYRSPRTRESFYRCVSGVLDGARGIRRSGSAALDLSRLAAGFLQGFWEVDLMAYDLAAGLLFLEETGCPYSEFDGTPYRLFESTSIVAARPGASAELTAITSRSYA